MTPAIWNWLDLMAGERLLARDGFLQSYREVTDMPPKSKTKRPKPSSRVTKPSKAKAKSRQTRAAKFEEKVAKRAVSVGAAEDKLTEAVRAGVARALREPGPAAGQF